MPMTACWRSLRWRMLLSSTPDSSRLKATPRSSRMRTAAGIQRRCQPQGWTNRSSSYSRSNGRYVEVAQLVARGRPSLDILNAVAAAASTLLGGVAVTLTRYDGHRHLVVKRPRQSGAAGPTGVDRTGHHAGPGTRHRSANADRQLPHEPDAELAVQFGLAQPSPCRLSSWMRYGISSQRPQAPGRSPAVWKTV